MDKIKAYIVGLIIVIFALIPPINFAVKAPSEYWPWWIVMAGFAGFYILFIKTNLIVKFMAIAVFVNCFFSAAPHISFTSYISVVACCYFFILCKSIKDYNPLFRILQCLLTFVAFMFIMQLFGKDRLLNFGRSMAPVDFCFGVVGQKMQSASFSVILAAALVPYNALYALFPFATSAICNSAGAFLCASFGITAYFYKTWKKRYFIIVAGVLITIFLLWMIISGKFVANTIPTGGRLAVWISTFKMTLQRPFSGWGISTYKGIFPALGGISGVPWKTTHNCWLQLLFELGFPIAVIIYGYFSYLFISLVRLTRRALFCDNAFRCLAGLIMISVNMCFHFPTRSANMVLIIIFFLAYCQQFIDTGELKWRQTV